MSTTNKQEFVWWSVDDAAQRGAISQQGRIDQAYKEGYEEGFEIGFKEARDKAIHQEQIIYLNQMVQTRYNIDAWDYLATMSQQQLKQIAVLILSCDSFDEIKLAMQRQEVH